MRATLFWELTNWLKIYIPILKVRRWLSFSWEIARKFSAVKYSCPLYHKNYQNAVRDPFHIKAVQAFGSVWSQVLFKYLVYDNPTESKTNNFPWMIPWMIVDLTNIILKVFLIIFPYFVNSILEWTKIIVVYESAIPCEVFLLDLVQ